MPERFTTPVGCAAAADTDSAGEVLLRLRLLMSCKRLRPPRNGLVKMSRESRRRKEEEWSYTDLEPKLGQNKSPQKKKSAYHECMKCCDIRYAYGDWYEDYFPFHDLIIQLRA